MNSEKTPLFTGKAYCDWCKAVLSGYTTHLLKCPEDTSFAASLSTATLKSNEAPLKLSWLTKYEERSDQDLRVTMTAEAAKEQQQHCTDHRPSHKSSNVASCFTSEGEAEGQCDSNCGVNRRDGRIRKRVDSRCYSCC